MAIGKLFGRSQQAEEVTEKDGSSSKPPMLNDAAVPNATLNQEQLSDTEEVSPDAAEGVKKIRATTIVWSRKALLVAYALIFLIYFTNSLLQQIAGNNDQYVTSDFMALELTAITGTVSTIVSGVIQLPLAKLMEIWGRPQGFILMLVILTIGLVMMAATNGVTLYAASYVFYWVGVNGITFCQDVFIADTSSLKWRALLFAFATSPYIATAFAGPSAAQRFVEGPGWRWGFGAFAIITPVISLPFMWVFLHNQKLAKKQGILVESRVASGRSKGQSVVHYLVEFDFFGILLICAGMALLLLPMTLANGAQAAWASPHIIAMIVIGACCLIAFSLHEKFLARKPFLPFGMLFDRTIAGACLLTFSRFMSFSCWNSYFLPLLQVVWGLSQSEAGYMGAIYNVGSCVFSLVIGVAVRWSGRFKWITFVCVPLQMLGTGLMIYFRQPGVDIGYVVMCQVFIAFSGGTLVICEQLAAMAVAGPEKVASVLALLGLFGSIGSAVGQAIAGAIWTNTFPQRLLQTMPDSISDSEILGNIASTLPNQLEYAIGTPERDGIIDAYGYSQRLMCIAATATIAPAMIWVMMWKDIQVKDFKKPAGSKII